MLTTTRFFILLFIVLAGCAPATVNQHDRCLDYQEKATSEQEVTRERLVLESASSGQEIARQEAIERLVLETGCPTQMIVIEAEGVWVSNGTRSLRLAGCGRWYVCSAGGGRVDCEPALVQPAP